MNDDKGGGGMDFFGKKEQEFEEILRRIERIRNHKLALAQNHG